MIWVTLSSVTTLLPDSGRTGGGWLRKNKRKIGGERSRKGLFCSFLMWKMWMIIWDHERRIFNRAFELWLNHYTSFQEYLSAMVKYPTWEFKKKCYKSSFPKIALLSATVVSCLPQASAEAKKCFRNQSAFSFSSFLSLYQTAWQ